MLYHFYRPETQQFLEVKTSQGPDPDRDPQTPVAGTASAHRGRALAGLMLGFFGVG